MPSGLGYKLMQERCRGAEFTGIRGFKIRWPSSASLAGPTQPWKVALALSLTISRPLSTAHSRLTKKPRRYDAAASLSGLSSCVI